MRKTIVLSLICLAVLAIAAGPALARQPHPASDAQQADLPPFLSAASAAQAPESAFPLLPLRSGMGGEARSVVVSGTLAYLGIGGQIEIQDTSALSTTLITTLPVPNHAFDLWLQGDMLYAANGQAGLQIIDVQDPTHPQIVGAYVPADISVQSSIYTVSVQGTLGYVSRANGSLEVLDLADPTHPVLLKTMPAPNEAWMMAASDTLLAVAPMAGAGITLYSLTDPANPQIVGTVQMAANDIALNATTLYIVKGEGFAAYDISNPAQPVLLSAANQPWDGSRSVTVAGTSLYVGSYASVPDGAKNSITSWDISDPAHPVTITSVLVSGTPRQLVVDGTRLFATYGSSISSGLLLLDIAGPTLTLRENQIHPTYPVEILKVGAQMYVLDQYEGLFIYDITPSSQFVLRANYRGAPQQNTVVSAKGLRVRNNRAYLTYWANAAQHFDILDVSNPAQPTLLGQHTQGGDYASTLVLVGNYAYVGNDIYDVTNPASLGAPIGQLADFIFIQDMAIDGTTAYIASQKGLVTADITNPAAPVILAIYGPNLLVDSVTVNAGVAYLTSWSAGIEFVNVSNPAAPTLIAKYSTDAPSDFARDSAMHSGLLNIAITNTSGGSYVQVVEVDDPQHPVTIAKTPVWGQPTKILDDGESLYVAAGTGGVVSLMNAVTARLVAPPTAVNIVNFAFAPQTLTVPTGTSVTWANADDVAHTITSDTTVWDSAALPSDQTFSRTFDTAGSFAYHCAIHPNMIGTIIVFASKRVYLPLLVR